MLEREPVLSYKKFSCSIQHDEKTIQKMYTTQYDQFHKKQELMILLTAVLIIALSILLPVPKPLRIVLLALGGWCAVSRTLPAIIRASDVVEKRGGRLPEYRYDFYDDHVHLRGEGSMNISYNKLIRLVEDRTYCYLFTGHETVMMLDKEKLNPKDMDSFREFLQKATGKEFKRAHSLLMLTMRDLIHP